MSTIKTIPVGRIFEYRKLKLQVVECLTCEGCYFRHEGKCLNDEVDTGDCSEHYRTDGKSVIFKQIHK